MTHKNYWTHGAILAIVVAVFAAYAITAHANPLSFFSSYRTATATTTLAFLSPGAATTTLTIDSFNSYGQTAVPRNQKIDSATLAFQYTASSTGPTLKMREEFSEDNVDWYPEGYAVAAVTPPSSQATTTQVTTPFHEYQFVLSTTTDNGGSGTAARIHMSLPVTFPTRYVRFIFYVPTSGGNGALWASVIPAQQRPE